MRHKSNRFQKQILIVAAIITVVLIGVYPSLKQLSIQTITSDQNTKITTLFHLNPFAEPSSPSTSDSNPGQITDTAHNNNMSTTNPSPAPTSQTVSGGTGSSTPPSSSPVATSTPDSAQPVTVSSPNNFGIPVPQASQVAAGIPKCSSHNVTSWHALYDPVRNCHYDHEHKDDPNRVNDLFGPVGAAYTGQSISYPWQTWSGLDFNQPAQAGKMENQAKHTGYLWLVRRRSDFKPEITGGKLIKQDTICFTKEAENCITDFRVQVHSIFSQVDANVRFHSYWLEARGCKQNNPSLCGTIKTGGVVDYGHLLVDDQPVALPQDDPNIYGLFSTTGRRVHGGTQTRVLGGDAVWYAQAFMAAPSMLGTAWGPIDKNNTTATKFYCSDPTRCKKNNGSVLEAEVIEIAGTAYDLKYLDGSAKDTDGAKNGLISYKGFTNRFGRLVENCSPLGIDCIPLEVVSLPTGPYQYRDSEHGLGNGGLVNYDTAPSNEFWIQYPSVPYSYSSQ